MSKVKFTFRLIWAYFSRFKGVLLLGIIIGILAFGLIGLLSPFLKFGKTERIGVLGRYSTDELPSSVLSLLGEGLTKLNENGTPEPLLAESWETPDKGKTWIFHLKKDVFWHDETPLTSSTIVYEFSDVEQERPDDQTIVFKLKDPYTPFPSVVSKPTFRKGLIGTGEWVVEDIRLSTSFVHQLTLVNKLNEKKIFKFYPTSDRLKLALKLGQVDSIFEVLDPTPFDTWSTLNVTKNIIKNQVVTLFFNTQDEMLKEKSFRQALIYAIEKNFEGERAFSPINPSSWAFNPQVKPYDYDLTRAKELLGDVKPDSELKIVVSPALLETAEKISKNWSDLGIKSNVQVSSFIPTDFQVFITIFEIPSDPDQYPLWHSTQSSTNIPKFGTARIDKLLEDGRSQIDLEERKKIYLDFQRFLLEELPAAFLFHPTYYTITRK